MILTIQTIIVCGTQLVPQLLTISLQILVTMNNLFNVADEALVHFINPSQFDSSLVHHVLFQENVLLEESFLGDSTHIFNHIERARKNLKESLFLEALRNGIIVPALREVGNNPYGRLFERWEEFYGNKFLILTPEYSTLRYLIKDALNCSLQEGFLPFEWPKNQNHTREELYLDILRKLLQSNSSPFDQQAYEKIKLTNNDSRLPDLWRRTKEWRTDLIEMAADRTQLSGRKGISRIQLVNVLGEQFNLRTTNDGSQIPEILEQTKDDDTPKIFLKWVSQCLHLSQAKYFGTAIHFPVYCLSNDYIATNILGTANNTSNEFEHFQVNVMLPPPEKLLLVDPQKLLLERRKYGLPYFESIKEWAYSSNSRTLLSVQKTLSDYAEQLCTLFPPETLYNLELSLEKPRHILSKDLKNGVTAVSNGIGMPIGSYMQSIRSIFKLATWFVKKNKYAHHQQSIDVTLPT